MRQDLTIRIDEVGYLDYKQAVIESQKRNYDHYITEHRTKELAGTLSETERIILEGETYGWPTPEPEDPNVAIQATQTCEQFIAEVEAYRESETNRETEEKNLYLVPYTTKEVSELAAYPGPQITNPTPEPVICPTPTPKPVSYINVPYRGGNPDTAPQTEYTLVKVNGQWYIAGAELLKFEP